MSNLDPLWMSLSLLVGLFIGYVIGRRVNFPRGGISFAIVVALSIISLFVGTSTWLVKFDDNFGLQLNGLLVGLFAGLALRFLWKLVATHKAPEEAKHPA